MDSGSVLTTKITSFVYSNVYPPISLNAPVPFGVGINSKAVTSLLSGEGSSLKLGSFLFGSPVSASDVSKKIFDINNTEDKTNISTPILSGSGKNVASFGSMDARASPKINGGVFAAYSRTSGSGSFKFGL